VNSATNTKPKVCTPTPSTHPQQRHVVPQRLSKAARFTKVPLEVNHHDSGVLHRELEGIRLGGHLRHWTCRRTGVDTSQASHARPGWCGGNGQLPNAAG
jgi:hypothetical protein